MLNKLCCVRRRNYWRLVPVGEFWYRSNMVKMAMSAYDSFYASTGILHYSVIRDGSHFDKVHGMHFVNFYIFLYLHPVKLKAHIKYNYIIIYSYAGHVATHFIIAADRNYSYFCHLYHSVIIISIIYVSYTHLTLPTI